ncbi:MAG: ubiquitin-like domain-containing protein [Bacteroidota bacterium]
MIGALSLITHAFSVEVVFPGNHKDSFQLAQNPTIRDLQEAIARKYHILYYNQSFLYKGTKLATYNALSNYNIKENEQLFLCKESIKNTATIFIYILPDGGKIKINIGFENREDITTESIVQEALWQLKQKKFVRYGSMIGKNYQLYDSPKSILPITRLELVKKFRYWNPVFYLKNRLATITEVDEEAYNSDDNGDINPNEEPLRQELDQENPNFADQAGVRMSENFEFTDQENARILEDSQVKHDESQANNNRTREALQLLMWGAIVIIGSYLLIGSILKLIKKMKRKSHTKNHGLNHLIVSK